MAFSVSRQGAESAGRLTLQALQPVAALHALPGPGLDAAFGAVINNIASDLIERRLADLGQPDLRTALQLTAQHAQYIQAKLKAWHDGASWGDDAHSQIMPAIAQKLDSNDIAALASYVEGLHSAQPTAAPATP